MHTVVNQFCNAIYTAHYLCEYKLLLEVKQTSKRLQPQLPKETATCL